MNYDWPSPADHGRPPKMWVLWQTSFCGRRAIPTVGVASSILELLLSGFGMRLTLLQRLRGFLSGAANHPQELAIASKQLARPGKTGPQGIG